MCHAFHRSSGGRCCWLPYRSEVTAISVLHRGHGSGLWLCCMRCAELSRKGWIARLAPRFSAEKPTILDTFSQLWIAQAGFIIGDSHRLRTVAGLCLGNTIKLAEVFLNLARTPGKVESFDWQRDSFHRVYLSRGDRSPCYAKQTTLYKCTLTFVCTQQGETRRSRNVHISLFLLSVARVITCSQKREVSSHGAHRAHQWSPILDTSAFKPGEEELAARWP